MLFSALPGIEMPMHQVGEALAKMWAVERVGAGGGEESPSEFRASQMNLILHFGLKVSAEEGRARFDAALRFAQRYPCRIIVLCPDEREPADGYHMAKIYSQCFIGKHQRDRICCEALMLRYHPVEASFLDDMVSIWLENDLPTCHFFNRVPAERIENFHLGFVRNCRRVLFDSADEDSDLGALNWPRPELVRDLAYARLLPVRQSLGQYLSGFTPADLAEGLSTIEVRRRCDVAAEAGHILHWAQSCLSDCAHEAGLPFEARTSHNSSPDGDADLLMEWTYAGSGKHLLWTMNRSAASADITADFGTGRVSFRLHAGFLSAEKTLAEACFFD
jgi:hypothetical protein